jgi:hypothetical protein
MPKSPDPTNSHRAKKPCKRCGTFMRYNYGPCVECVRQNNVIKYAKRRGKQVPTFGSAVKPQRRTTSEIQLGFQIAAYHNSHTALERSARLDRLIRRPFKLDGAEEPAPVVTGGDLYRATLPVGVQTRDTTGDYTKLQGDRHAENEALKAAIGTLLPTLPDLITCDDVLRIVPPEIIGPMAINRRAYAASRALTALGVAKVRSDMHGRRRIFTVRDARRYRAMTLRAVVILHASMHNLPPPIFPNQRDATYQREVACPRCGGHTYRRTDHHCLSCEANRRRTPGPREAAKAAGQATYIGAPCAECGGTVRRTSNHRCVVCDHRHHGAKRATVVAREAAKAAGATTYVGAPCAECGGTARRTSNYHCLVCTHHGSRARRRRMVVENGAYGLSPRATENAMEKAAGMECQSTVRRPGSNSRAAA